MSNSKNFPIDSHFIEKLLSWADGNFPYMAYFSPHSLHYPQKGFDQLFFAGDESFSLDQLNKIPTGKEKVGIMGYDLKNQYEKLESNNSPIVDCPDSLFFTPTLKIKFTPNAAEIFHVRAHEIYQEINSFQPPFFVTKNVHVSPCTTKEEYIRNVGKIRNHIIEGDIYEMNYCMAFKGVFDSMNPLEIYLRLTAKSPMPFSSYFKAGNKYLAGASPERFLKKTGAKIIAQPIKGTIKRGATPEEDEQLRQLLQNSEKERAENLMIVDLMRNDLSRISEVGMVKVEELFGIYSFKNISQMISTLSSTVRESVVFEEIIEKTFPMGSMTGAPKIRCMELIDRYENFKRGWFSGALGYISYNQDFDFNVVIRSIIIDKEAHQLYFAVGSAITYDADPLHEYEECLLKAHPIFEALKVKLSPG
jgi:para-aminobenzoate synthetase component 1